MTIRRLYREVQNVKVFEDTLDRNKDDRKKRARRLSELLRRYEELLDLREREETIDRVLEYEEKKGALLQTMAFEQDLKVRQRGQLRRKIEVTGEVSEAEALSLLDDNIEDLKKYLYYISAGYIKKIGQQKNADLLEILEMEEDGKQLEAFGKYLGKKENILKLQKIFPVIATTCISAHRLGSVIRFPMNMTTGKIPSIRRIWPVTRSVMRRFCTTITGAIRISSGLTTVSIIIPNSTSCPRAGKNSPLFIWICRIPSRSLRIRRRRRPVRLPDMPR